MLMEELFTKIVFTDSFPLSLIGVIHAKVRAGEPRTSIKNVLY